jgi:hypothetical protein
MALLPRTYESRRSATPNDGTVWAPSCGAYLTDGAALFCVGHTLSDSANGHLFLELEDCASGDVILCPARAVAASGLRPVKPATGV